MFVLASEGRLGGLLQEAGFTDVRIEDVPVRFAYRDVEEWLSAANDTGGAFAKAWQETPEDEQAAIKAELEAAFAPFAVDGGYELPGLALVAIAS